MDIDFSSRVTRVVGVLRHEAERLVKERRLIHGGGENENLHNRSYGVHRNSPGQKVGKDQAPNVLPDQETWQAGELKQVSAIPIVGDVTDKTCVLEGMKGCDWVVHLPKTHMPGALLMLQAAFLTWIADITKKPPLWQMSLDSIRTIQQSLQFDGSKAERELGITYTPIRVALEEEIASHQN